MDKQMQALFRVKADERIAAKPSVAELRAARKAQKQQLQPAAARAPPPTAMAPPPPRRVQPSPEQAPATAQAAPAREIEFPQAAPAPADDEPAVKRMRVAEPQPVPSTSAPASASAGALPAGFFDNKQLDKKARGVEEPKLDPKLEWKMFQESVQDGLKELEEKEAEEQEEEALAKTDDLIHEQQEQLARVAQLREQALKRRAESKVKPEPSGAASGGATAGSAQADAKNSSNCVGSGDDEDDEDEELVLGSLLDWRARGTA